MNDYLARLDNALEVESRDCTWSQPNPGVRGLLPMSSPEEVPKVQNVLSLSSEDTSRLPQCYIVLSRLGPLRVPHAHKGGARTNECSIVDCV